MTNDEIMEMIDLIEKHFLTHRVTIERMPAFRSEGRYWRIQVWGIGTMYDQFLSHALQLFIDTFIREEQES